MLRFEDKEKIKRNRTELFNASPPIKRGVSKMPRPIKNSRKLYAENERKYFYEN